MYWVREKLKSLITENQKNFVKSKIKEFLKSIYGQEIWNSIEKLSKTEFSDLGKSMNGVPISTCFWWSKERDVTKMLEIAKLPNSGQTDLWDGRTGENLIDRYCWNNLYAKTHHLVEDKIHARSTGPYSLVTQQP